MSAVILISDGRPTEGDRRESVLVAHATQLRGKGFTMSSIGLGLDYNEDLMEHMAVEGGGRYHYMRNGDQLAQILNDELEQASAVVAADVKLYMPRDLGGLSFADAPGAKFTTGEKVAVDIGDLASGEERHVLVKMTVTGDPTGAVAFQAPELVYRKVAERTDALLAHKADPFKMIVTSDSSQLENSRKDDVHVRVLQVEASLALTESMTQYAKGDANGARVRLEAKKAELHQYAAKTKSATLAREAANFDDVLNVVSAAPAASSEKAQDMIKDQKARAFELRR